MAGGGQRRRGRAPAAGAAVLLAWASAWGGVAERAAGAPAPLPDPLTLEQALVLGSDAHPSIHAARARLREARARIELAGARSDAYVELRPRLRWVAADPAALETDPNDHGVVLVMSKPVHEFGRRRARIEAARADAEAAVAALDAARLEQALAVMDAFFAAVLADLAYVRDNEDMAVVYVRFDQMRDRHAQGQISDLELLEWETRYHAARSRRYASDGRRRVARARLAERLGRPGELPRELVRPRLRGVGRRPPPEPASLLAQVLEAAPSLRAARAAVAAARHAVAEAAAGRRPLLRAEMEAQATTRRIRSRDRARAGLVLEVPLFVGRRVRAAVAAATAALGRAEAEAALERSRLRERVWELAERIAALRARRDEALVELEYRELYLDRARALYQMEVRTDLGDAMVRWSEAKRRLAEAEFGLARAWAELQGLRGRAPWPLEPATPRAERESS